MNSSGPQTREFTEALENNAAAYGVKFTPDDLNGLSKYYELLQVWNSRLHLVAPVSPEEFATRHVLESLLLLEYLPKGARVADIGSGAGLPIIPCLIVRPDLEAVLIEASKKKAVFLREALSQTPNSQAAKVVAGRFENISAPHVGFITCRALERFQKMLPQLFKWVPTNSTLLLFGGEELGGEIKNSGLPITTLLLPNSKRRFLFVVNHY